MQQCNATTGCPMGTLGTVLYQSTLNAYYFKKVSTTVRHELSSVIVSSSLCRPPAACNASFPTSGAHAKRGRPTFFTNTSTAGLKDLCAKVASLMRLPSLWRATLPYNSNCCFCKSAVSGRCPVVSNTVAFETLDTYAGLMPQIVRRHLFWKPFSLRRWLLFSHAAARPYIKMLTTTASKI